jgi:D-arginine dehydrogenase
MQDCDFLIIGAGMAGACVGYFLAGAGDVIIAERETQPAYHTTGRSAAFYVQSYGPAPVRRLTLASWRFFNAPPAGFCDHPLLTGNGSLYIARRDQAAALDAFYREMSDLGTEVRLIGAAEALARVPVLRRDYVARALAEPSSRDIDVAALLQGFLRGMKQRGGQLWADAGVRALRRAGGRWIAETSRGPIRAPVVINAAGAWGDEVALLAGARPIGLRPLRRTIITFDAPPEHKIDTWPLVLDVEESFYFKPEAGRILATPADETLMPPCDVQPDEIDVAIAADRIKKATTLKVRRIHARWAGLRSFSPDRVPVVGMDPAIPGFFWFVGQGGYGIQTAPAMGRLASGMIAGQTGSDLTDAGVSTGDYRPGRFAQA